MRKIVSPRTSRTLASTRVATHPSMLSAGDASVGRSTKSDGETSTIGTGSGATRYDV